MTRYQREKKRKKSNMTARQSKREWRYARRTMEKTQ